MESLEAHVDHNNPRFNNDIAIITVTEPFDFSDPNVQPIGWFTQEDEQIPEQTICNRYEMDSKVIQIKLGNQWVIISVQVQ